MTLSFEDLINAFEKFNLPRSPIAYVMSRSSSAYLEKQLKPRRVDPKTIRLTVFAFPIYTFADVPRDEVVVFYDSKALSRYAELRETLGHSAAIQRLSAYVESELVRVSTIRALLETS